MFCFIIRPFNSLTPLPIADVSGQLARVQEARLFAALLESGWGLKVNEQQAECLKEIHTFFPVSQDNFSGEDAFDIPILIDHLKPITRFGHVERPLIFPTWLFRVGASAIKERDYLVTFQGFPSNKRVELALEFIERNWGCLNWFHQKQVLLVNQLPESKLRTNLLNGLFSRLCRDPRVKIKWSTGGRTLACKIVDVEYWSMLHRSFAVYCPEGDCGWTYRFFEAMLAGALPVIDAKGDFAYARPFTTFTTIKDFSAAADVAGHIAQNQARAFALVTAFEDLKPKSF